MRSLRGESPFASGSTNEAELLLKDSFDGGSDLKVTALNGSFAAEDLGIIGDGVGQTLEGNAIGGIAADIKVTLTNGSVIKIDLSGLSTLDEVISKLNNYGESLTVTVNAAGTGLVIRDSSDGLGNLTIEAINGSLAATDLGILGTGTGAVLNGTSIVSGGLLLDGRNDPDTLIGSTGDDILITSGSDSLTGGVGVDTVVVTRDTNMTLSNSSLSFGAGGSTSLTGIEQARLLGGESANAINASAFSLGSVTIVGGAGNDTLTGGSGNDLLSGGLGTDVLDGQGGTDSIGEMGQRIVLDSQGNGVGGAATLDLAEGTDEVVTITLGAGITGGNFTLTFNGETTGSIPFDADSFELKSILAQLEGLDREDLLISRAELSSFWTVKFVNAKGGLNVSDLTATSVDLVGGGVTAAVTTQGAQALNSLTSIEQATLYGTFGNDVIDASDFSGTTLIQSFFGNDTVFGSNGADTIDGGDDDDRITGGGGVDSIAGSGGIDTIVESRDVHFTLTNTTLTETGGVLGGSTEVDSISGFEWAHITGGNSGNTIDVSAFTGLTDDVPLELLNGGNGFGATSGKNVNIIGLEGTTPLTVLNNGAGVRLSNGTDFVLVLRDGTTKSVDLGLATTVKDVLDAIQLAAPSVTATLDSTGTGIVLKDSTVGGGNLRVQTATNTSADLGLTFPSGEGVFFRGQDLNGLPISNGASDILVVLSDGSRASVDLSNKFALQNALDAFTAANSKLIAALDAGRTRVVLTDTAGGASSMVAIAVNGSTAGTSLGLIGAGGVSATASLTGVAIGVAQAAIDGGGGNDSIIGTVGDDVLTGGTGEDTINGGSGTDTLVEERNANMTLGVSTLVIGGETDTLTSIEKAELTGGTSVNTIDASLFAGSAIIRTGGGLDTLKGPLGDATFIVSIEGLTAPTSATDTARQITVYPANGNTNYTIEKSSMRRDAK